MFWISRYFIAAPLVGLELIIASFFINLLALAVPLFVTLVLQRYVTFGVDSTLLTLTSGALIAIIFEMLLRNARLKLAIFLGQKAIMKIGIGAAGLLATIHHDDFQKLSLAQRNGLYRNIDRISTARSGQNICTLLDIPFAALFVGVVYLFNPSLALVIFSFIMLTSLISWLSQIFSQKRAQDYEKISSLTNEKISRIATSGETARLFDPTLKLLSDWKQVLPMAIHSRNRLGLLQGKIQNQTALLQALLSIIVIAYGAVLVLQGALPVSILVGVNILATRALAPFVRLSQMSTALAQGTSSHKQINKLAKLKTENNKRPPLPSYRGKIECKDLSLIYDGQSTPLFEHLTLTLQPSQFLVIRGNNGSGKTSLAHLLLGLNQPTRGHILADNTDINQLPTRWWRQQINYFPQQTSFIGATIKENLLLANPALDENQLRQVIAAAGLTEFINKSAEGLDMAVSINGDSLSYGIARRLAFARALANFGKITLMDEPTDGLDEEGRSFLYRQLDAMSKAGQTLVICSNEPDIIKRAHIILDLNAKPVPQLTTQRPVIAQTPKRQIRIIS